MEAELAGLGAASTSDDDADSREAFVERMKSLFSRSLLTCADVELWCLYIKFIRDTSDASTAEGVASIREAYEYTTSHIGQDVDAGPIWFAYAAFLKTTSSMLLFPEKASDDGTGPNALQGAAQTAAMRAIFKQALAVPSETTTETMWRDYELFENGASKALAKTHLNEMTPIHVAAKMALTKRRETRACLLLNASPSDTGLAHQRNVAIKDMLAVPPETSAAAAAELDAAMRSWADVLSFEMSNVQRVDTDLVVQRVKLVFEQGLRTFHLVAAWWLSYGKWLEEQGLDEDAVGVWTRATTALPACLVLHFAKAECEEARGNIEAAAQVYESLVRAIEVDAAEAAAAAAAVAAANSAKTGDGARAEMSEKENESNDDNDDEIVRPARAFATDEDAALVYLTWFRFAGRAQSVDDARAVVKRAKKSPIPCPWQVYAGAALMEWGWRGLENETDTEKLCCRYFDLGLKHCPGVINLILSYANFLEQRGNDRNVRALFEREIANGKGMKGSLHLKTLWDAYIRFEMTRSSMTVIRALETRRKESLEIEKAQGMSAAEASAATAATIASAAAVAAAGLGSSPANVVDAAALEPPCIASCYDFLADCEMRAEDKFETLGLLPMRPDALVLHRELRGNNDNGDGATETDDAAGKHGDISDDEPGADTGAAHATTGGGAKGSPAEDYSLDKLTPWPNGAPIAKDCVMLVDDKGDVVDEAAMAAARPGAAPAKPAPPAPSAPAPSPAPE